VGFIMLGLPVSASHLKLVVVSLDQLVRPEDTLVDIGLSSIIYDQWFGYVGGDINKHW
jgi:hypothetical protein